MQYTHSRILKAATYNRIKTHLGVFTFRKSGIYVLHQKTMKKMSSNIL